MKTKTVLLTLLLLASLILCSCSTIASRPETSEASSCDSLEGISMKTEEQSEAAGRPTASALPVHAATQEFLTSLGITDSMILSMDYDAMKKVAPVFPEMEWNFAEDLYYIFRENFPLTERESEACAEEGDFVLITFPCRGINSTEQLWVLTSKEKTILSVQTELIGKKKGEEGTWLWEKRDESDVMPGEAEKIDYRVERIMALDRNAESGKTFLRNNQFHNVEELYQSIVRIRLRDLYDTNQYIARTDYLHEILACCEFSLAENEVQSHAEVIGQPIRSLADVMGIPVEQYWKNILYYQTVGVPLDPDYNTAIRLMAEEYIKEQLCMGALAVYKKIDITEQEVEEFCGYPKKDVFEADWQENCCAVLEDKVLYSMEPRLSESRIIMPETRSAVSDETQDWQARQEELEKEQEGKIYISISEELSQALDEMNESISQINLHVYIGEGSKEENRLMQYLPLAKYNGWVPEGQTEGCIRVCLVAEEDEMETAIALFEKLVGKYEGVEYKKITEEEAVFH